MNDNPIGELIAIVMWIARSLVLVVLGGAGLVKIVKGQSDENPKERNEGLLLLGAAGIIFAATFAVSAIFLS